MLFRIADGRFQQLKPTPAVKERDLQRLIEANLIEALDVHLLATEYGTTTGGRIDTLGVDKNGSPMIIEYKRNQNDNVINQALSYLLWLTGQKREFFEMLMARNLPKDIADGISLDWKNPRVICIAENFNRFDIDTVEVVPNKIELITYRFYEGDIFGLEPASARRGGARSPSPPAKAPGDGEAPVLAEDGDGDLLDTNRNRGAEWVRALFDDLRAQVKALGTDVVERPTRAYIAY